MPDYLRTARLLRAKAADPVVPDTERQALLERADDLEKKYSNSSSRSTNDTTGTGTGPFTFTFTYNMWQPRPETEAERRARYAESERQLRDLFNRQSAWNPPPWEEDIVEKDFRHQPEDEDYGYDLFEEDDY